MSLPDSYKLVPSSEIKQRLINAQKALAQTKLAGIIILQSIDRYYFTGTLQDGTLWLPTSGEPVFWVRRSLERAQLESPLKDLRPQPKKSIDLSTELRSIIAIKGAKIGMELDVVPVQLMARIKRLLPDTCEISDASPLVRSLRACKSPYEISCIKGAATIMDKVMLHAANVIQAGMSEIELMAELEHKARRLGHLGIVRMRGFNNELFFGHTLSGPEGTRRGYLDAPTNGLGLSPAFSQGAGRTLIRRGVPISIDFMVNYEGYLADLTRMLSLDDPPESICRTHENLLALNQELTKALRPGCECGAIFSKALEIAADYGFADYFLGHGEDKVSFVGHGVGLEVDEFPFIARNNKMLIENSMVVALEPKLTFPAHSPHNLPATAITTETTYVITPEATIPLTLTPDNIKIIKR